jgi:hypothetical protein
MLCLGYEVFRTVSPHSKCDLVVIKDGDVKRIEVRTAWKNHKTGHLAYATKGRYDHLAAVLIESNEIVYDPPLLESKPT